MSGTNCLGKLLRESGHNLVPEPPHKMTGKTGLLNVLGMEKGSELNTVHYRAYRLITRYA